MKREPIAGLILIAGLVLAQDPQTPERLKSVAERYAQAGQPREAAAAYEQVVLVDTNARAVLAPLLVRLYIESRQPRPALEWARQVMTNTPDPQAYLAGVYAAIGSHREARALLEHELARSNSATRAAMLKLQLERLEKSSEPNGKTAPP
jgi:regulator of sirC expression with transglutaminase-like and TPR domain